MNDKNTKQSVAWIFVLVCLVITAGLGYMAVKAESGFSYEEISRKIGVTFSALSRFGSGVTKSPNQLTVESIERFVNEEEGKA